MVSAPRLLAFAAALAILGSGCRHAPPPPAPAPDPLALPVVARASWKIESAVPDGVRVDQARQDYIYQGLTDRQAQCLASARSSKANLFDQESDALGAARKNLLLDLITREHRNRPLKQEILRTFALEERNQTAGQALELFHRIAEAEAKADVVRAALADVETASREIEKRRKLGLPIDADMESVETQEIKLRQEAQRLDAGIDQGNESLAMLIGAPAEGRRRFLPQVDWRPDFAIPDQEQAVADALENRPGYRLTESLRNTTDFRTLSAAKLFLQTISVATGSGTTPTPSLIGVLSRLVLVSGSEEAASRQQQMSRIHSETERLIASEVTQALNQLRSQVGAIELAQRKAAKEQARLKDLEAKLAQGLAAPLHLVSAKLQVRQAQAGVIEELASWHVARVRLRRAQGRLVAECGSESRCSCCGRSRTDYSRLPDSLAAPPPP